MIKKNRKYIKRLSLLTLFVTGSVSSFAQTKIGSLDLADFSGNEIPDLIFGNQENNGNSGIAINSGSGNFNITGLPVYQFASSLGWADLNNDGYLDYYAFGSGQGYSAIYYNNGEGLMNRYSGFDDKNWLDPDVSIADFDNDSDPDLFVSGWDVSNGKRYSRMFTNTGHGLFTETNLDLIEKGFGSSSWADVNADGFLDLLLNGDGDSHGDDGSSDIYRLYLNQGNGVFSEKQVFQDYRQISVGDGSRFVDWDNDGDFDIILTGWSKTESRQATCIFLNDGSGSFSRSSESDDIPGVSESSIEVADINKDNKIDLLLTGYSGDYSRRVALLYFNETSTANTRPSPPSGLTTVLAQDSVQLSWGDGTDTETPLNALSYNIALRDLTNQRWIISPGSITDPVNNGFRITTGMGNAFLNNSWHLHSLPTGKYAWTVQTIDAVYSGSVFPEEIVFAVKDTSLLNTLIREAEGLISIAVEGSNLGQYEPGSISKLQDTLTKVKPWVNVLDKMHDEVNTPLLEAMAEFHASRISVDIDSLQIKIEEVGNELLVAEIGDKNGMYSHMAYHKLDSAIASAESVRDSAVNISDADQISSMQDLVDAEILSLDAAIAKFMLEKITVDYSLSTALIDSSVSICEEAPEGESNGDYPAEAKSALSLAIEDAQLVRSSRVSQEEADAAAIQLQLEIDDFYSKLVVVNFEGLGNLIDSAQFIHDTADADNYVPGAKFKLMTDIATAKRTYRNSIATQVEVDAATLNLENDITEFFDSRLTGLQVDLFRRLKIFPNPARDFLYLENLPDDAIVLLMNLSGKTVYTSNPKQATLQINVSRFERGPVLLRLIAGSGLSYNKMIIIE